jgi:hypothetical protein
MQALEYRFWPVPDLPPARGEVCSCGSTGSRCPGRRSVAFDPMRTLVLLTSGRCVCSPASALLPPQPLFGLPLLRSVTGSGGVFQLLSAFLRVSARFHFLACAPTKENRQSALQWPQLALRRQWPLAFACPLSMATQTCTPDALNSRL